MVGHLYVLPERAKSHRPGLTRRLRMLVVRLPKPAPKASITPLAEVEDHELTTLVTVDPVTCKDLSPADLKSVLEDVAKLSEIFHPDRSVQQPRSWNVVTIDGQFETTVFLLRMADSRFGMTTGYTIWRLRWPRRAYEKNGPDMQQARSQFTRQLGLLGYDSFSFGLSRSRSAADEGIGVQVVSAVRPSARDFRGSRGHARHGAPPGNSGTSQVVPGRR